jgi:hypothetical protein
MPVRIIFRRTDDVGNVYYTDGDGQIIDKPEEENEYVGCFRTPEYEEYIDSLTEEDLARQRAEGEARYYAQVAERERKAKGLAVRDLTKLGKPKVRKMLWKNYWAERELCILAGDNGVGKSLVALKIAKSINNYQFTINSEGQAREDTISPNTDCNTPRHGIAVPPLSRGDFDCGKVLYVDFEMVEEDFVVRFGDDIPDNFTWVGLNAEGEMPTDFKNKTEWLLQNFTTTIEDTDANIIIVDQPDRLSLSPQKWMLFLANLKSIMRKKGLSVMLIVSNKPRHIGRPCGLNNIPKGNILIPEADSIVMLAQNNRHAEGRYLKVMKNRNRRQADDLELVDVLSINENEGYLDVEYFGAEPEKHMLPPNAVERKNRLIIKAEKLWDEGLCYMEIAERMELPEGMVKRWLRPLVEHTTSPLRGTPPTLGGEGNPCLSGRQASSFDYRQKPCLRQAGTPSDDKCQDLRPDDCVSGLAALEREILNSPAHVLHGHPLTEGDFKNDEILLQQQGFERVKVRVSMP